MATEERELPRVVKHWDHRTCGFCGGDATEPGSRNVYPIVGEPGHIQKRGCPSCADEQEALSIKAGYLIVVAGRTKTKVRRGRKAKAAKPKKMAWAPIEPVMKNGRISNRTKLISNYLAHKPMGDHDLLKALHRVGAMTTLVEVRDSLYRLRNRQAIEKVGDAWYIRV